MKKAVAAFLFLLYFASSLFNQALADENFKTDYNAIYTVNPDSSTHVSLDATLTNLTDRLYISSYSIELGFNSLNNLKTSDEQGVIVPSVVKKSNGTQITIKFNKEAIGLNQSNKFNISFDTTEVAKNFNNTWELNIPGVSSKNDFSSFNVTVNYPSFLGKPTFIKPVQSSAKLVGNSLIFNKQDLGDSGISIAFGNFQIYDFNLKYHLQNTNLFSVSTEIALPPTTNYQDISVDSISPKPVNVRLDKDGNWLAEYLLGASKKITVNVSGKAKVYLNPREEALDDEEIKDYTVKKDYWESDDYKIKNLASELKTPYAIYNYIVNKLHYDFSRVETKSPRLGAVNALDNPNSAVCLEFTDLFVALARAAGIPAREIDGYAFTSNESQRPLSLVSDILHAWPEYYDFDKKTWVMVDPTWGNTTGGVDYFNTLDFDHIAFVIKGENSSYPVPAGGYKLVGDASTKDVNVEIGSEFKEYIPGLSPELILPDNIISGFDINGFVKLANTGNQISKAKDVEVIAGKLTPSRQSLTTKSIPPFGYQLVPISFDKTGLLTNTQDTIKITVGNSTSYKNVKVLPFFVNKLFILGGISFVIIAITISLIAYIYRRLSLSRQKKESDLRWESNKPPK